MDGKHKVNNQIQQLIAIMKLCDDMKEFRQKFDHVFNKTLLQYSFSESVFPGAL